METYYTCQDCGHIHASTKCPTKCEICKHKVLRKGLEIFPEGAVGGVE